MEILALIPARGGSKSIPRKNIRPLAGYPLLAYSIAAGLQAKTITRTIVSTDDDEIAAIARQYGAETPFQRPAEFAQDNTTDLPVFEHALRWLAKNEGYRPEIVVQLRPTSPIRPPDCVDQAVQLLLDHPKADSVRGVVPAGQNPHKMWRITPEGSMTPLLSVPGIAEPYNAPRQALPPIYWQTGHIDAIRTTTIYEQKSLSGKVILPLLLESRYTIDIDTRNDWQRAEWLITQGDLPMVRPSSDPSAFRAGKRRPLPQSVELVVFDFDGVMTDDRVWTDQNGQEMVAANRGDGMGIALLRKAGIPAIVLSTEPNPVVAARCRKLGLPVLQGVGDKASTLEKILAERQLDKANVIYLGNDINDVPCFPLVGCAVVVADAHPAALQQADLILQLPGGHGAVRELCDMILHL
ncbi:MAG: acylneuraminate cytidylyltransferase [Anaerolineales bacterium]|nr:acylneuraminate cytidylyltransferase [Anaerolineales bacterium]